VLELCQKPGRNEPTGTINKMGKPVLLLGSDGLRRFLSRPDLPLKTAVQGTVPGVRIPLPPFEPDMISVTGSPFLPSLGFTSPAALHAAAHDLRGSRIGMPLR
jgi:hypothetical protein